ncbi:MAG TPA: hypothetical protein VKE74_08365 [Gemmataceae bacterium]|nr:hypothetical protein [Gemmataceae bacterium]
MMGTGGGDSGGRAAQEAVYRLESQLRKAEKRADRLALVVQGLFRVLAARTGATEAELQDALAAIAQEAQARPPVECPGCGRPLNAAAPKCMYCGESRPVHSLFDVL